METQGGIEEGQQEVPGDRGQGLKTSHLLFKAATLGLA